MEQAFNPPLDHTGPASSPEPRSRLPVSYILGAAALLAAVLVVRYVSPPAAGDAPFAGLPSFGEETPPWWQGTWQARLKGGTWRLTLDVRGRGRLVRPYTHDYYLSLPVIDPEPGEDGLLFLLNGRTVPGRMPWHDYFLLQPDGADACRLYQLKTPPAQHSPDARLLPATGDGIHTLIARLERIGTGEAALPPVPGAGQGID